ncbi:hypothetical protein Cni_G23587 [Canna indica]|uniref:RNase H type-1 domain-containing protein n=1 Tax=Canna indica TaxID=4628 RepID=A0AAQ3QMM5_9LILI|nr:hypothetical protein Cni_G23587 [Canna indica]
MMCRVFADIKWNVSEDVKIDKSVHIEDPCTLKSLHHISNTLIFCDASWKSKDENAGIGAYITDQNGFLIDKLSCSRKCSSPLQAEIWAIRTGVCRAKEINLSIHLSCLTACMQSRF